MRCIHTACTIILLYILEGAKASYFRSSALLTDIRILVILRRKAEYYKLIRVYLEVDRRGDIATFYSSPIVKQPTSRFVLVWRNSAKSLSAFSPPKDNLNVATIINLEHLTAYRASRLMAHSQSPPVHRSRLRRKACSSCVKSKRRCDLVLPRCSRCETKNLGCGYVSSMYNGLILTLD